MAKKERGVIGTFLGALGGGILGRIRDTFTDVSERVQEKVFETLARLVRELYLICFTIISVIFVLLGIIFLINERLIASKGESFLIVGLVLLVIVLLYRSMKNSR